MVILDAEYDPMRGEIKYIAACKKFRALDDGEMIPEYIAIFENENIHPRWQLMRWKYNIP